MGNVINLKKTAGIVLEKKGLANVVANVVLAMDTSGSMYTRINNGEVQDTVDRLLAVGMNMDVDKSIDVYTFNTRGKYIGSASESNHSDFVRGSGIRADGGTEYAPVMNMIITKYGTAIEPTTVKEEIQQEVPAKGFFKKLLGKTETVTHTVSMTVQPSEVKPVQYPTIVFFVTDGDNFDKPATIQTLREASKQGIFWQFVGIGSEKFEFLKQLDDLSGRYIDNANFYDAGDIANLSDAQLYDRILDEIPGWFEQAKQKGLVL